MQELQVQWAGQVEYDTAWDWQKKVVAEKTAVVDTPDQLILLEHPPTYTLGRKGTLDNLLLDEARLDTEGFTLRWVDRGGDITYHGPGQLVGYPILNLKRYFAQQGRKRPDLHQYLRQIEEVIIQTLDEFGIDGWRYDGYTGVWGRWAPPDPKRLPLSASVSILRGLVVMGLPSMSTQI